MHRRFVEATQSLCLADHEEYANFAVLLESLCSGRFAVAIRICRDDRGRWNGRFRVRIRPDLGAAPARLFTSEQFVSSVPYGDLVGGAIVSLHAEEFEHRIANLRPDEWTTAVAKPRPSKAGLAYDGREIRLTAILSASCVSEAISGHLNFLAADTPQARPVHQELADFARCLRTLTLGNYPITLSLDGRGIVLVDLDLKDLDNSRALYAPTAPDSLDLAGDCILSAHSRDVDAFVAGLGAEEWQRITTAWRFKHWGLSYEGDRARLSADASRVWHSINARLSAAASDAPTE